MQTTTTEYRREYNKKNYDFIRVTVTKEEHKAIKEALKKRNPNIKMSGYVKNLILKDLEKELGGVLKLIKKIINYFNLSLDFL